MSGVPTWARRVLYVLLAVGCFIAFMVAGRALWLQRTVKTFEETHGVVEKSAIGGDGRPHIVATFEIAGAAYEANAWLGVEGDADRSAKEVVNAHPIGSSIPVYYDPRQPERSTLQREVDVTVPIVVAFVLVVLSAWVALKLHRAVGTNDPSTGGSK